MSCSSHYLYAEPKHGQYDTTEYGKVTEPEPEGRPVQYREGDMETSAYGAGQNHHNGDDCIGSRNTRHSLTPGI
jgi:hypothetical protein